MFYLVRNSEAEKTKEASTATGSASSPSNDDLHTDQTIITGSPITDDATPPLPAPSTIPVSTNASLSSTNSNSPNSTLPEKTLSDERLSPPNVVNIPASEEATPPIETSESLDTSCNEVNPTSEEETQSVESVVIPQNPIATLPEETALSACPLGNKGQSSDSSEPNDSPQPMESSNGLCPTLTLDVSLPLEIFASLSSMEVEEVRSGAGSKEKELESIDGAPDGRKLKQQGIAVSKSNPFDYYFSFEFIQLRCNHQSNQLGSGY